MKVFRIVFFSIVGIVVLLALILVLFTPKHVGAATNISSSPALFSAWNDVMGWLDFYSTNSVQVSDTKLTGYASSSVGDISLDCLTTRRGNICGTSNYGVCNGTNSTHQPDGTCLNGDGSGHLIGYGWNDYAGWISFNCLNTNIPCTGGNYSVNVDSNGDFSGWAWSDAVGWINFNCSSAGSSCSPINYRVNTAWHASVLVGYLESSIFDTQITTGSQLNSITWQGTQPAGTAVDFQIALSNNSAGPWAYFGPDGTSNTYFGAPCSQAPNGAVYNTLMGSTVGQPICVTPSLTKNFRYLRYKVRLQSNLLQNATPNINDIILNWSL